MLLILANVFFLIIHIDLAFPRDAQSTSIPQYSEDFPKRATYKSSVCAIYCAMLLSVVYSHHSARLLFLDLLTDFADKISSNASTVRDLNIVSENCVY